ncbi:unnamed protein product [Adineta ricciae]|uniref:Phage tail collar domain-containing protein n=1 Tax=Adineta ricciae TaxID=249248 RepID=A0A814PKY4_ADIRI|nr:unnamed protein product [Adineta ricciae]
MIASNTQYPRISDWSTASFESLENRNAWTSSSPEPVNTSQIHRDDPFPKTSASRCSYLYPCLPGLLLAILSNLLTLGAVIVLWLVPHNDIRTIPPYETPTGTIVLFVGNLSTLNNTYYRWLLCDGSEVSRVTYSDLFSVINTLYGSGNGNNTFNLPDLRGRFPLGNNDSSGSSFILGGASSLTLTVSQLPAHSHSEGSLTTLSNGTHAHSITDPGHNHGGSTGSASYSSGSYSMGSSGGAGNDNGAHTHIINTDYTGITIQSSGSHTHTIQGSTGSQGANQPVDIMPPYHTTYYIIRA